MIHQMLTLQRNETSDEGTFGTMTIDGVVLRTVELPWRDNQTGISCIPPGTYLCIWTKSPTKGWCYRLQDTTPREGILIHVANFGGDTAFGWQSDLEGCIAVGIKIGTLINRFGREQQCVLQSRVALREMLDLMDQRSFKLEVLPIDAGVMP